MSIEEIKTLSASRIKTFKSCSWQYHCNYILRLPQRGNDGSKRGSICHDVFELLINSKHKNKYDEIINAGSIKGSSSINRYVMNKMRLSNIVTYENYELIDTMIMVGLKWDFFCNGGELLPPEYKFDITSENPKYKINGFIDKAAIFNKDKKISIYDYKSSKKKFTGEDYEANIQAMMYSLAAKKLWPDLRPVINFMFLRFPKQPFQTLQFSDEQLAGFEASLEFLNNAINKFSEDDATSNFAFDNGNQWMCYAGKTWECEYLRPFEYYVAIKEGKITKRAFKKEDIILEEGEALLKKHYNGCPRHTNIAPPRNSEIDF